MDKILPVDFFEEHVNNFSELPFLVIVGSVEAKWFPYEFVREPMLDLCCGDVFSSSVLGLKNISRCDISERAIQLVPQIGVYSDLKVCDIRKLPYEDNSFNTILSNCVLEHVEEVDLALLEVGRVLMRREVPYNGRARPIFIGWLPSKKVFKYIGMREFGGKLLDKYSHKQAIRNIWTLVEWGKLLDKAGFKILHHFYLFNEGSYKIVMVCDWLSTLRAFNIANRFFRFMLPCWVRKAFWRRLLKKYYLNSMPLNEGGELVIVAKNEK